MTADEPLPGILSEIEKIVGREKAIELAIQLGGKDVRIPKSPISEDHDLVAVLGLVRASLVWEKMAGDRIHVPHAYKEVIGYLLDQGSDRKTICQITDSHRDPFATTLKPADFVGKFPPEFFSSNLIESPASDPERIPSRTTVTLYSGRVHLPTGSDPSTYRGLLQWTNPSSPGSARR